MNAAELRAKLECLTLVGQDEDGDLEWVGTAVEWREADTKEREYYEQKDVPGFEGTWQRFANLKI